MTYLKRLFAADVRDPRTLRDFVVRTVLTANGAALSIDIATQLLFFTNWQTAIRSWSVTILVASGIGAAASLMFGRKQLELYRSREEGVRQKDSLAKQGQVISLLLKDYEEQTSDWLWETDERLRFRAPSARFIQAAGRSAVAIQGGDFSTLIDISGSGGEEALRAISGHMSASAAFRDIVLPVLVGGEVRWWSVSGKPLEDERRGFAGYRGVISDVTEARLAEDRIRHLAQHDALTNLPNRATFSERLETALHNPGAGLAVLSIDLDNFKPVNDRYGHPVGDKVLIAVAERLRGALQREDIVARFGGDEFLVARPGACVDDVEALCRRIVAVLAEPFDLQGEAASIGASIGVAFLGADGATGNELIKNADAALYRAKAEGRDTFRFFEPEMDRKLQDRQRMIQDLRHAVARNELVLHYQPFVNAATDEITGYEALIRWNHPTRGLVPPGDFIPLAEASGLINSIGMWVIENACMEAARWPVHQRVSVNISPVQFLGPSLAAGILTCLMKAGLSPERLEIEVTESILIDNPDRAIGVLRQIKAMGMRVALDDFGIGYSSLSYLRYFPFDKVKIDRCFVQDLDTRADNQVIVRAIRDIAKGLGMSITAEGVETAGQAAQLKSTGCEELQGYLFARPKPADRLSAESLNNEPSVESAVA